MNKQSNVYTVLYIVVLVVVVGVALALTAMSLKDKQQENINADKMKQILASVSIVPESGAVISDFDKYITEQRVVNENGEVVSNDAFSINMATESKVAADARQLPVYVCTLDNGEVKYILPVYGAGLWGPIWGYVALNDDASTIYGTYFTHESETPGLGAEIEKPAFQEKFQGKEMFKGDNYLPIAVVKKGQKPAGEEDYVDGVSGGTITSKGVGAMISACLTPYEAYLRTLRK